MQRRHEERVYPEYRRATWRLDGEDVLRPARVVDRSRSGIGLLVGSRIEAHHGDPIMIEESNFGTRRARIVRVASQHDPDETHLGCRWITAHAPHDRRDGSRVARRRTVVRGGAA